MSVREDEQNEILEEEVVVEENETTELVEMEKEAKKAKAKKVAKKVGKVAAVVGVGILGYILGTKSGKKSYDDSEIEINVDETDAE